jgi:hypothetical protein
MPLWMYVLTLIPAFGIVYLIHPTGFVLYLAVLGFSLWERSRERLMHVTVGPVGLTFLGGRLVPWASVTRVERKGRGHFAYVRIETSLPEGAAVLNFGSVDDPKGLEHAIKECAGSDHAIARALAD